MVNIPKINMFFALQFPNAQLPAVTGAAAAGNRIIVRPLIHFDDDDDSGSTTDSDEF